MITLSCTIGESPTHNTYNRSHLLTENCDICPHLSRLESYSQQAYRAVNPTVKRFWIKGASNDLCLILLTTCSGLANASQKHFLLQALGVRFIQSEHCSPPRCSSSHSTCTRNPQEGELFYFFPNLLTFALDLSVSQLSRSIYEKPLHTVQGFSTSSTQIAMLLISFNHAPYATECSFVHTMAFVTKIWGGGSTLQTSQGRTAHRPENLLPSTSYRYPNQQSFSKYHTRNRSSYVCVLMMTHSNTSSGTMTSRTYTQV